MLDEIVRPTVAALARRGIAYRGVLYAGLMITPDGPKLIEYNARFGDPECQVLMLRLKDDLLTILKATVDGVLDQISVRWRDEAALSVVMATNGYPGAYETGSEIRGLNEAAGVAGRRNLPRRHEARGRRLLRRRRARARRDRHAAATWPRRRRAPTQAVDRDRLAAGFLPPRHRLARDRREKSRLSRHAG